MARIRRIRKIIFWCTRQKADGGGYSHLTLSADKNAFPKSGGEDHRTEKLIPASASVRRRLIAGRAVKIPSLLCRFPGIYP